MTQNIRISRSFVGKNGKMLSMPEVVELIKNSGYTKRYCDAIRTETDKDLRYSYKEQLYKCEFTSVMNGNRCIENITALTGYLVADIDDYDGDYDELREKIIADKVLNPVLVFTSPSGKLKCVLKLKQLEYAQLSGQDASDLHREYYKQVVVYFAEKFGVVPDTSVTDGSRIHYLSHDENPYYDVNEPECAIPFYPIGDDDVEREYLVYVGAKNGGNEIPKMVSGDFDSQHYLEKINRVIEDIKLDENGDFLYDRDHKEFVGSRSEGTAKIEVSDKVGAPLKGYDLKFRLNVVAMWLFGGDVVKADDFLRNAFDDYGVGNWNRCSNSHKKYEPNYNVFMWLLKTYNFQMFHDGWERTTISFMDVENRKSVEDITVASKWGDLMRKYCLPKFLDNLMQSLEGVKDPIKDATLYSFITVMSGFARRQEVWYNGEPCGLNLILNVLGSAASGKSAMLKGVEKLLPSLNYAAEVFFENDKVRANLDRREYERAIKNGEDCDAPLPARQILNTSTNATLSAFIKTLQENNGKFVLVNPEYSNITRSEKGQYGGLLSAFKDIFDNHDVGCDTKTELKDGFRNTAFRANCAVMLSGTFGQFDELYKKNIEDGLLSRSIYYTLPTPKFSEYELPDQMRKKWATMMSEIEMEFLQWHFWCALQPDNHRQWRMREDDFKKMKVEMKNIVVKYCEIYCLNDEVGGAIQSFLFRLAHNVTRVAALLSSLAMFERFWWNPDLKDPKSYAMNPTIYKNDPDSGVSVYKNYAYDDYVNSLRVPYGDVDDEVARFNAVNDYSYISFDYMMAALEILTPSIIHGIRAFERYRNENLVKNSNPLNSEPIYLALQECEDEFTFSDYKQHLAKLRVGKNTDGKVVTRALNRLVSEGMVEKKENNYRIL